MFTETRIGFAERKHSKGSALSGAFFVEMLKMEDVLYSYIKEFENLFNFQYRFIIGRKGTLQEFVLDFRKEDFHHIIGLKHLDDVAAFSGNRTAVFDNILSGKITLETVKTSVHFEEIAERFDAFKYFCGIFKDKQLVFKYLQKLEYSKITADYLLMKIVNDIPLYAFIKKRNNEALYCCKSFFPKKSFPYEKGQTKYTLLALYEKDLTSGEETEIYKNLNYKEVF